MITIEVWSADTHRVQEFADDKRVVVGRLPSADVQLPSEFVSIEHAVIYRVRNQLLIETAGTNPTWIDGVRAVDGIPLPVKSGMVITIRSFKLRVLDRNANAPDSEDVVLRRLSDLEGKLYEETLAAIDFRSIALIPDRVTKQGCDMLRSTFEAAYARVREAIEADAPVRETILSRLMQRLALQQASGEYSQALTDLPLHVFLRDQQVIELLDAIVARARSAWETRCASGEKTTVEAVLIADWLSVSPRLEMELGSARSADLLREECFRRVVNLAFGLGPLEDLLENPAATEILIVGPERIYIELGGRLRLSGERFPSPQATRRILERAVSRHGRRIDTSQPLVDAQLGDGSRLNAVIAPLSRSGDALSIRKFRSRPFTLQDLVSNGSMSSSIDRFLTAAIHARKNIVIVGGTGSGKTTMLGALAAQVDPAERLILLEDTAEIQLPSEMHVVCLQTRHANVEGKGEVTMRQLVRNALRMRPDRLIVGECRGVEVIDMLQAMNTGHPGSFTTIHANATQEVVSRIEVMVLHGVTLPLAAIRQQVASAIDLIVHVGRLQDGHRRVIEIAEVAHYDDRRESVAVVPVIRWGEEHNRYEFTGWVPTFMLELEGQGRYSAEDLIAP